jgi:hypothetical protein
MTTFACFSTFLVTLNTNKADVQMDTDEATRLFKEDIKELLDDTSDSYREVFGDPSLVHATLKNVEAEYGEKKHRLHFHVTWELEHDIPRYSGNRMATRMLNWFNVNLSDWIAKNSSWYINLKV